ncbi:MAG: hypothetical protein AB4080_20020 [Trichodesmium sp.]
MTLFFGQSVRVKVVFTASTAFLRIKVNGKGRQTAARPEFNNLRAKVC